MPSSDRVELVPWAALSVAERQAVCQLETSEAQVEFAGTTERAVAAAISEPGDDVVGLAVRRCEDGAIVGFLVLKRGARAPDWAGPGAAAISALRIAWDQQGRGLGTAALRALAPWTAAHWPGVQQLALSVDEHNPAGIRAYAKAGFADRGVRDAGRYGWVRQMSRPVAEPGHDAPDPPSA